MGAKISFGLATVLAQRLRHTTGQLRDMWEVRKPHEELVL
jgi:hypothetical protein